MLFDPDNNINSLCAKGMELEGEGKPDEAAGLFLRAWDEAQSALEKCTAAHYVARHQKSQEDKLAWDKISLSLALDISGEEIKATYPSFYLNVARGLEEAGRFPEAKEHYLLALSFVPYLPADGYGRMIQSGIEKALSRLSYPDGSK